MKKEQRGPPFKKLTVPREGGIYPLYTMEKIANHLELIRTKLRFFGSEVWELF